MIPSRLIVRELLVWYRNVRFSSPPFNFQVFMPPTVLLNSIKPTSFESHSAVVYKVFPPAVIESCHYRDHRHCSGFKAKFDGSLKICFIYKRMLITIVKLLHSTQSLANEQLGKQRWCKILIALFAKTNFSILN